MATTFYDNRTHPIYQGQNCTNSLQLVITTYCSMRCPRCSISIPKHKAEKTARHATLAEMERDSVYLQGLRSIKLTGGEPTIHPKFREIVEMVRERFHPSYLAIETNGVFFNRYRTLFKSFDLVFITHYEKDAIYPGSPDNTKIIELAEKQLGSRLIREVPVRHTTEHFLNLELKLPGTIEGKNVASVENSVKPFTCSKWTKPGLPSAWYNGKLYACAVSLGIDERLGVPVTEDWREKIRWIPKGCSNCCFRGT